ncbi:MAG: GntR family transcriptional regulator [Pseudomonadota bacterium]
MIETTTVVEKVRDFLRDQIIQGELQPGDRVVQGTVADQLGVSRIPIREAIHALISEGLLNMEPHHGAVVSPVSVEMANEVFGLRAMIEPRLLKLAGEKMNKKALQAARKQLTMMKRLSKRPEDFKEWAKCHWAFHTALYSPSEQSLTLEMVRHLMQHSERYMALEVAALSTADTDHAEHKEMLTLCEQGEFEKAAHCLSEHILRTPASINQIS